MADSFLTIEDLLRLNDKNANDLGVSNLLQDAPIIRSMAATLATNGAQHKFIREIGAPNVGFRAYNEGRYMSKSNSETISVDLKVLDASCAVDMAEANAYTKGGASAYIAREATAHLKAGFFSIEKQVVYGTKTNGNTEGFQGLADSLTALTSGSSSSWESKVVNAGGSTALTSVYLVRYDADSGVALVLGNEGQLEIGDTVVTPWTVDNKTFTVYYTPIVAHYGVQVATPHAAVRIANIGTDTGKGLTDDLIYSAIERFPSGRGPTHIWMNRRSHEQLRKSRTATTQTGEAAPLLDTVAGLQIIKTDALVNTEAALV